MNLSDTFRDSAEDCAFLAERAEDGEVIVPPRYRVDCVASRRVLPRERFRPLALFGPRAMSDLSPECAPKRTSANASEFMGSRPR